MDHSSSDKAFQANQKGHSKKFEGKYSSNNSGGGIKGKYPPCRICKRTNHLEKDCRWKGKPQYNFCKMFGHIEKDCRKKPKQAQAQISECDDEDHLFCAYHARQTFNDDVWLVDSGCSNHMTKNSSCFIGLDNSVRIPIRMGNGAIVQ